MKKIVSLLAILICFYYTKAQDTDQTRLDELREIVNQIAEKHHKGVQAVTNFEGKTEFWSFGYQGDTVRSYEIWSYQDEQLYSEYYVERNGQLIHAVESETFIPVNHYPQQGWNVVLFIDNDKIIYMTSMGHGKTEDNSWRPEEIIEHFAERKKQSEQIKEIYNSK